MNGIFCLKSLVPDPFNFSTFKGYVAGNFHMFLANRTMICKMDSIVGKLSWQTFQARIAYFLWYLLPKPNQTMKDGAWGYLCLQILQHSAMLGWILFISLRTSASSFRMMSLRILVRGLISCLEVAFSLASFRV